MSLKINNKNGKINLFSFICWSICLLFVVRFITFLSTHTLLALTYSFYFTLVIIFLVSVYFAFVLFISILQLLHLITKITIKHSNNINPNIKTKSNENNPISEINLIINVKTKFCVMRC